MGRGNPKLVFVSDQGQQEYQLSDYNTIGRFPDNTIQLLDKLMSKHHAMVVFDQGHWLLRDLGSSNGSFVNEQRVESANLSDGDVITVGGTHFTFVHPLSQAQPQVTMTMDALQSHIQASLQGQSSQRFESADKISDWDQLRRDYEKLRIAYELNQAIGLEPDIDTLLQRILDETFQLLAADRGVIMLMDDDTKKLETRAVKQVRDDGEIVLSSTIVNHVVQSKEAVLTSDAMVDARFNMAQSIMMQGMRSTMCVPMVHQGQLLGIIHLDSLFATGAFEDKDLQILSGVAAQAAQALDNANKARLLERNALARRDFERLLPAEVVEQVIKGDVRLERGGELRDTTILFSDVRGFTAWSEQHEPAYIVSVLNDYFELMVDAIHRHGGTLDKFMGDGIMALFGAPISHGDDAVNAVSCAVDMMKRLARFNEQRNAFDKEGVNIGIGLNSGGVVAGYMGSSKSMEYTAIGDHVNLAARLCSVATAGQILISEHTLGKVDDHVHVRSLPPVQVKGKRQPQKVFEVVTFVQDSD